MKDFLKTMGWGIAVLFTSFISVSAIACSCIDLFVDLPDASGLRAVGIFVLALARLLIGGGLIYVLGCIRDGE